jgi:diphthamide synthase (EF-2-diphthine--ammonia ligase)
VPAGESRISMHGVRRELLARQADALNLPSVEVEVPAVCINDTYEQRMRQAFASPPLVGAREIAFGDASHDAVRAYREMRLEEAGRRAIFGLWDRPSHALAREVISSGFAAVVGVDPGRLDPSFAGAGSTPVSWPTSRRASTLWARG